VTVKELRDRLADLPGNLEVLTFNAIEDLSRTHTVEMVWAIDPLHSNYGDEFDEWNTYGEDEERPAKTQRVVKIA
jgi:hypothetical protein